MSEHKNGSNWEEDARKIGEILRDQYNMRESPTFKDGTYEQYIPPPSFTSISPKDLGKQTIVY